MISVENITDEYGAHGVRCYSVVHNMDFYTVDVRASGFTVLDSDEKELDDDSPLSKEIVQAVSEFMEGEE